MNLKNKADTLTSVSPHMNQYITKIKRKLKEISSKNVESEYKKKIFFDYLKYKLKSWASEPITSSHLVSNGESPNLTLKEKLLVGEYDRRNFFLIKCKICLKEVSIDILIRHSELCLQRVRLKEDIDKKKQEIARFHAVANENMRNNQLAKRLEM